MISMRTGMVFLVIFFLINCNTSKKTTILATKENTNKPILNHNGTINSALFLENRVGNCDSAIVLMKNAIKPGYLTKIPDSEDFYVNTVKGLLVPGESYEFLSREVFIGRNGSYPNQRFYLSLDCLIGKDFQYVLDIFVEAKYHQIILKHVKEQEANRNYFPMEFYGDIQFELVVVNRKVVKGTLPQVFKID